MAQRVGNKRFSMPSSSGTRTQNAKFETAQHYQVLRRRAVLPLRISPMSVKPIKAPEIPEHNADCGASCPDDASSVSSASNTAVAFRSPSMRMELLDSRPRRLRASRQSASQAPAWPLVALYSRNVMPPSD
jgi:hypothetical protein